MKPFNLEDAKAGKPVQNKRGDKVELIYFDRKGTYPIVGLIESEVLEGGIITGYTEKGEPEDHRYEVEDELHLVMAPTKLEGWINLYKNTDTGAISVGNLVNTYNTKEEAERSAYGIYNHEYLGVTKIEWEE